MSIQIPEGRFEGYIFDCDGTLADTMPLHYKAWCMALEEHGCGFPEALFYELGGVPARGIVGILNERHQARMPVEETAHRKEAFFEQMIPEIAPIEPVIAIVNQLYGGAPLAVASGGRRNIVTATLRALGVLEKFAVVVTSEDYVNGKPSPEPFLKAAELLGIAAVDCLVFEDTPTGAEAARAAGMKWVIVPPPVRLPAIPL